jgi:hypothetical protein
MGNNKARGSRQRKAVNQLAKRYPGIWDHANAAYLRHRSDWPAWCYLPSAIWRALITEISGQREPTVTTSVDAARLAALGAWRLTQGVYQFHPALFDALLATPLERDIPASVFESLPSRAVYIETPGSVFDDVPALGFYAHLDPGRPSEPHDLRLTIDIQDREIGLIPLVIPLTNGTLIDALELLAATINQYTEIPTYDPSHDVAQLAPLLSLLLYLCTHNADCPAPPDVRSIAPRNAPPMLCAPDNVTRLAVGTEIGPRLVDQAAQATKVRAAHWRVTHRAAPLGPQMTWIPPASTPDATYPSTRPSQARNKKILTVLFCC